MSKLTKPAQVGNTIFGVGVDERMVIDRAQREHDYQQTPAREAVRIAHAKQMIASLRAPHAHTCMTCGESWYCPHPPGDCKAGEQVFPSLVLPGPNGATVFHHACKK